MKQRESGFALLLVFLMAAVIALSLYMEIPRIAFESQRQKEQLLIERGEQYKRAIKLFVSPKGAGHWPTKIEDLENFNNRRYLRHRYLDPMTGKDEWRLVHIANGVLTDSVVTKPVKADDKKTAATGNSYVVQIGGMVQTPVGQGQNVVNPALRRRPSDSAMPGTSGGSGQPDQQMQAAMAQAAGQQYPGQIPGQQVPGQPALPQFPGQVPGQQVAGQPGMPQYPGQVPGQQVPGQPGMPQNLGQAPGQQLPGQLGMAQVPGQPGAVPNQTNMTGQQGNSGAVGGSSIGGGMSSFGSGGSSIGGAATGAIGGQPGAAQAGRFPGQQGLPGAQSGMQQPGFPQAGMQQQPGFGQSGMQQQPGFGQSGMQQQPGFGQSGMQQQPGFGQSGMQQAGMQPGMSSDQQNNATKMIGDLLTRPRPNGMPAAGPGSGGTIIGGGIAGVASKAEADSIMVYNDHSNYSEWEFIYDPMKEKPLFNPVNGTLTVQPGQAAAMQGQMGAQPGAGTQPGQSGTQPGQPGTQPGQPGSQPGQFGTQPGMGSQPGQMGAPGQFGGPGFGQGVAR